MRKKYTILIILAILSFICFLTFRILQLLPAIIENLDDPVRSGAMLRQVIRIVSNRSVRLLALIVSATLTAITAVMFQTFTNNRILTPSVLGFDSIYLVVQTLLVFILGFASTAFTNVYLNFFISTSITLLVVNVLYQVLLKPQKNNITLLLLVGIVISTLASNFTNILQVLMNPEEFQAVREATSVTITNIETNLVWISIPILVVLIILIFRKHHIYDVMSLGESQSINLGVDYQREVKTGLILISIGVSVITALVGPLAFLGLIVANSAREITKRQNHKHLFITASLLSFIFLILGQAIIETTGFLTTVTVLINFIGGIYMIYLILRGRTTK